MKAKKTTYVIDTNVFLTDYEALDKFGTNDIVIPLKVLEEIDKHKKRQDGVGLNARHFIRMLDELREKSQKSGANLQKGIRIGKNRGLVRVVSPKEEDLELLPIILDKTHPDNNIICVALIEKEKAKNDDSVILVSLDVNMRVKCDSCGVVSETYTENQVVKRAKDIYTGYSTYLVHDSDVDDFYSGNDIFVEKTEDTKNFKPNQYVVLTSSFNEKKTALAFFKSFDKPLRKVKDYTVNKDGKVFGVVAKNREQRMLLDLLMNDDAPVVTILGSAGCGKSLLAIAASLELVLSEDSKYEKLLVSRPVVPMGRDIGFLPGPIDEKMRPWLSPIEDNLEFLLSKKENKRLGENFEALTEKGVIQIEALTYIRGRSIANSIMIIDEAQNLTPHEVKTILTRVGDGTKIILTGDIEQIDNTYINESTNGLTYAIEKLKDSDLTGHVTLQKGERSKVAALCAQVL